MRVLRAVLDVVKDLTVGDDWRMIVGIVVTLMAVGALRGLGIPVWWVPPLGSAALLIIGVLSDPPTRQRP